MKKLIKLFLKKWKDTIAGLLVVYNITFTIYGTYLMLKTDNIEYVKTIFGIFVLKTTVLTLLCYVLYIQNSMIKKLIDDLAEWAEKKECIFNKESKKS